MGIKLDVSKEPEVKLILKNEGFQFYSHEHAFWRAKKGKATAIFYRKGTFLIQGDAQGYVDRLIGNSDFSINNSSHSYEYPVMGFDESGKGDYFGPLVLAGVTVSRDEEKELARIGAVDSKKLSDSNICSVALKIMDKFDFGVKVIEPEEYNLLYSHYGNLNLLLVDSYRQLIAEYNKNSKTIIIDKFSQSDKQNQAIKKGFDSAFIIVEKAESYPSVAAASILARYHFVKWFDKASSDLGYRLPLGSGPVARKLFNDMKNKMSPDEFALYAKTHFKSS